MLLGDIVVEDIMLRRLSRLYCALPSTKLITMDWFPFWSINCISPSLLVNWFCLWNDLYCVGWGVKLCSLALVNRSCCTDVSQFGLDLSFVHRHEKK